MSGFLVFLSFCSKKDGIRAPRIPFFPTILRGGGDCALGGEGEAAAALGEGGESKKKVKIKLQRSMQQPERESESSKQKKSAQDYNCTNL